MPDAPLSLLTSGAPATVADMLYIARAGGLSRRITIDELLAVRGAPWNYVINGQCEFAQRKALSGALVASTGTYASLDRWCAAQDGSTAASLNQVNLGASFPGGSVGMRLGRAAGSAAVGPMRVGQPFESRISERLQGKVVTVSFMAAKGPNWSAVNNELTPLINYGTGNDQSGHQLIYGTWTGWNAVYSPRVITAAWARYTITGTIPANATQVGVAFSWTPTGTAGADDGVYIADIRLHEGPHIADYCGYRPAALELALCQRYLPSMVGTANGDPIGAGKFDSTTAAIIFLQFPVSARVKPTGLITAAATEYRAANAAGATLTCNAAPTLAAATPNGAILTFSFAAGGVAGDGTYAWFGATSAQPLLFTGCEL